jgi:hypothetical protein
MVTLFSGTSQIERIYDARRERIDWKHYKHPLPENVYDVYLKYWKDVEFRLG